jgi:hypothetical protein
MTIICDLKVHAKGFPLKNGKVKKTNDEKESWPTGYTLDRRRGGFGSCQYGLKRAMVTKVKG